MDWVHLHPILNWYCGNFLIPFGNMHQFFYLQKSKNQVQHHQCNYKNGGIFRIIRNVNYCKNRIKDQFKKGNQHAETRKLGRVFFCQIQLPCMNRNGNNHKKQ